LGVLQGMSYPDQYALLRMIVTEMHDCRQETPIRRNGMATGERLKLAAFLSE